jgi:3-dehydroquinate synthase
MKDAGDIVIEGLRSSSTLRFGSMADLSTFADLEKTVIVADQITSGFVPEGFPRDRIIEVARGEAAKNLVSLEKLYEGFLRTGLGRDWTVVGLGGGSVSDLAGFAASTWLRGVDFGFVPTTLLAMVDASVGGKNGIDYRGYKNLVGTFNQPRFVLFDVSLLASLPAYDLACGLAEAVKHALIEGGNHLPAIEEALGTKGLPDHRRLGTVIRRSVELKASVANADERESGLRRKLNLGHTIGHGIESITGLPHGACVAAGLVSAFRLAVERGGSSADADRVTSLLARLGLPTGIEAARRASSIAGELSPAAFREALAESINTDKKRLGGDILFALPMALGDVRMEPIPLEQLREFTRRAP